MTQTKGVAANKTEKSISMEEVPNSEKFIDRINRDARVRLKDSANGMFKLSPEVITIEIPDSLDSIREESPIQTNRSPIKIFEKSTSLIEESQEAKLYD